MQENDLLISQYQLSIIGKLTNSVFTDEEKKKIKSDLDIFFALCPSVKIKDKEPILLGDVLAESSRKFINNFLLSGKDAITYLTENVIKD
jgi:hypothetical protein